MLALSLLGRIVIVLTSCCAQQTWRRHASLLSSHGSHMGTGTSANPSSVLACAEGPPGLVRQHHARTGGGGSAAHAGARGEAGSNEGGEHARSLNRLHELLQQYFLQVKALARCSGAAPAAVLPIYSDNKLQLHCLFCELGPASPGCGHAEG